MKSAGSFNPVEAAKQLHRQYLTEGGTSQRRRRWVSEQVSTSQLLRVWDYTYTYSSGFSHWYLQEGKQTRRPPRALDPLLTPWRIPCAGSSWLEYPSLLFNKVRWIFSRDLIILRKCFCGRKPLVLIIRLLCWSRIGCVHVNKDKCNSVAFSAASNCYYGHNTVWLLMYTAF